MPLVAKFPAVPILSYSAVGDIEIIANGGTTITATAIGVHSSSSPNSVVLGITTGASSLTTGMSAYLGFLSATGWLALESNP
jgi:hypothetical protein